MDTSASPQYDKMEAQYDKPNNKHQVKKIKKSFTQPSKKNKKLFYLTSKTTKAVFSKRIEFI